MPLRPWVPTNGGLGFVGLAALAYFAVNFLLVEVAVALHERSPLRVTLRQALPYQAFVSLALLSAAPLVVVVMNRSVLLVLLFLLPLIAIYANAAISMQREYQALHDQLTGLPNRALLLRRTGEALADAARTGGKAGFLLLDLDRFKEVNDTLGHPLGDGLLQAVAYRLARSVRPADVVARLGGDEFAVLLPAVRTTKAAREVAARLRAALAEPVRLDGMSFEIEASVGIALYPDDADTVDLMLQRADVAMYLAKEQHTGVERYRAQPGRPYPARLSLLGDLRRGIDHGEFELYYQPTVYLAGGRTAGMEALLRWQHPSRGRIGPAEFIPLAEQSFIMRDLTAHVVRTALHQASAWRLGGLPVRLSVNVSVRDLLDAGLAGTVEGELAALSLPPEVLLVEVSDRALTSETDRHRGRGDRAARARRPAQPGRLRHRLRVAGPAPAAPGGRGEDRSVLRLRPGQQPGQPGHRAFRGGPGARARHPLGGRGGGDRRGGRGAAGHGLRRRAGARVQPAAERRRGHRVAGRRPGRAPGPGRPAGPGGPARRGHGRPRSPRPPARRHRAANHRADNAVGLPQARP